MSADPIDWALLVPALVKILQAIFTSQDPQRTAEEAARVAAFDAVLTRTKG